MALHLDLLARLHRLLGAFGVLAGLSLMVLAAGAALTLVDLPWTGPAGLAGAVLLAAIGAILVAGGLALAWTGRALGHRRRAGRAVALVMAAPTLVVVPFGTALGIYTFWVLLNDEARLVFGRPPRTSAAPPV